MFIPSFVNFMQPQTDLTKSKLSTSIIYECAFAKIHPFVVSRPGSIISFNMAANVAIGNNREELNLWELI